MSENKIPLPGEPEPVPDLLKYRKWFGTPTDGLLLDFAKPYTPPKWTLCHNGINFAKCRRSWQLSFAAGSAT